MANREKKRSIFARIRNYFIAGVVVLIPIGITVYLPIFLISISSKILPKEINPNHYLPYNIPGVEILTAVLLITLIGWLSVSFLGKKLLNLFNNILKKIPILRTIYSAIVQMTETFTRKKEGKKNVVLVEYPRKGSWAVGFGVVGTKTFINFLFALSLISPEFSFVAKPTAQVPFLGYSTKTTFFFTASVLVNVSVICPIAE